MQLGRLIQNLTSLELPSIERQSPDSIFRESEETYNVALCNCVPSSNIIVSLLGHLTVHISTTKSRAES
jgi:hypothetical protein